MNEHLLRLWREVEGDYEDTIKTRRNYVPADQREGWDASKVEQLPGPVFKPSRAVRCNLRGWIE